MRFLALRQSAHGRRGLRFERDEFLLQVMPRSAARFRVSIKDNKTGTGIKVELIDAPGLWGERRYRLRLNGREPTQLKQATLTEVFDRLRRWLVRRAG